MKLTGNYLFIYFFSTILLATVLWALNLWSLIYIFYALLVAFVQVAYSKIIFKYRESSTFSTVDYFIVVPTVTFMIAIIKHINTPFLISIFISFIMLIPIHFLEKYIKTTEREF